MSTGEQLTVDVTVKRPAWVGWLVGHTAHSPSVGVYASHHVSVLEGTCLARLLGTGELDVPTYHHQAVLTHPGYVASARHEDGTVEAMEDPGVTFRLAVQWHPEAGDDGRLFEALVGAARDFRPGGRH